MTVLRCTYLDGSWHVLDGRPQREARFLRGAEGTENPRVGGSIPPLGTNRLESCEDRAGIVVRRTPGWRFPAAPTWYESRA